nr:ATP-binding protein [Haloglomus sp. DT116]
MSDSGGWETGERTTAAPIRVLCVTDDGAVRARVESQLREAFDGAGHGLSFAAVTTAEDALTAVWDAPTDCVVTAQTLPDGTGVELTTALRERTTAPVVLFTDGGDDDLAIEAARAGVSDYLPLQPGDADGLLARRVLALATDARSRRERDGTRSVERQLRALQRTARDLNVAESVDEIGEIAVGAAADILDLEVTGIWRYDDQEETLVPVTMTATSESVVDNQPAFERGEGLAWRAFETGEVQVYDDVSTVEGRYNPDTPIGSEIIVPLGEQGILVTGSTSSQEFSGRDVDLFRVLGASVEAAMIRARREAELRRQNERLDEFASVVSHDLRNPLSVAEGFLDLARDSGDPADFDRVEDAHDRIGQLVDDLLTLARGGSTVEEPSTVDLGRVARDAWEYVDTGGATLTRVDDLPTVQGDGSRLVQLFENLFRNSVEHSSTGSRPRADDSVEHGSTGSRTESGDSVEHSSTGSRPRADDGDVTVTVGPLDGREGFFVADDGPGIDPEHRDDVFEHGVSFTDGGTGFGLSIVEEIADAHGWQVAITDSPDGGARFEFETGPRRSP